jgi:hypothetical protein
VYYLRKASVEHRSAEADAEPTFFAFSNGFHQRFGFFELPKNKPGLTLKCDSRRSEYNVAAVSTEKQRLQFRLDLLDRQSQWRLRHAKSFGRATEMFFLSERRKIPKLSNVQDVSLQY